MFASVSNQAAIGPTSKKQMRKQLIQAGIERKNVLTFLDEEKTEAKKSPEHAERFFFLSEIPPTDTWDDEFTLYLQIRMLCAEVQANVYKSLPVSTPLWYCDPSL